MSFPFKDSAERINNATNRLTILDQPFFKIHNGGEELRGMEFADMNTTDSKKIYFLFFKNHLWKSKALKKDVVEKSYDLWLNDDMINFFSKWLLRNQNERYIAAHEIVDTVVTTNVTYFMDYTFKKSRIQNN